MKRSLPSFYKLVESLEALPSVGKKSALKLAYYLSVDNQYAGSRVVSAIEQAMQSVTLCTRCNGLSENELCDICTDGDRQNGKVCLVDSPQDIFLIEQGDSYDGQYFVLNALDDKHINSLLSMAEHIKELIFALSSSIQNDSVMLYIEDKLQNFDITFYKIATGIPTGVKLENVDALSLSQALTSKVPL